VKVVIQCAGRKRKGAPTLKGPAGEEVVFVAHPELCRSLPGGVRYCRPDDAVGPGPGTWRDALAAYNREGQNPLGLLRAADLYGPRVYRALAHALGWDKVFILSAGWGLIRSDFLTPAYDITCSCLGEPRARRGRRPARAVPDFNHLQDARMLPDEEVHFLGGRDYLPLYYLLTGHLPGRKIIHHKGSLPHRDGYSYEEYRGPQNQNWHYAAARAFIGPAPI
jgi:hypothetical protein